MPSGFVKTKSWTGLPASLSSETSTVWKRPPRRIGGTGRNSLVSFSIGPLWHAAQMPAF